MLRDRVGIPESALQVARLEQGGAAAEVIEAAADVGAGTGHMRAGKSPVGAHLHGDIFRLLSNYPNPVDLRIKIGAGGAPLRFAAGKLGLHRLALGEGLRRALAALDGCEIAEGVECEIG